MLKLNKYSEVYLILWGRSNMSDNETVMFLRDIAKETLSDGFVTRDGHLTWCDLTPTSQEKLLENTVNFQGSEI
jgi:hypothetical protein